MLGQNSRSKANLQHILQNLPAQVTTPMRQYIQQVAQGEDIDLTALGFGTPLQVQPHIPTMDAHSIDSVTTKARDLNQSQGSVNSQVHGLELPPRGLSRFQND